MRSLRAAGTWTTSSATCARGSQASPWKSATSSPTTSTNGSFAPARGSAWAPGGSTPTATGRPAEEALRRLNALRERLRAPLLHLRERGLAAETAEGQAAALAAFLEELRLPEQLERRSQALEANGQQALAAEYRQLWELTVSALEQAAAILGESAMDMWDFGRLFLRMLSQYDVGIIPVSLDRVSAGDFDRMRRRTIRHLLVLGGRGKPGLYR